MQTARPTGAHLLDVSRSAGRPIGGRKDVSAWNSAPPFSSAWFELQFQRANKGQAELWRFLGARFETHRKYRTKLNRLVNGQRRVQPDEALEIWKFFGLDPDEFPAAVSQDGVTVRTDGSLVRTKRDFPVHTMVLTDAGETWLEARPVEFIPRPPILDGVASAYGLVVPNDRLSPVFNEGELLLIHPRLPPQANQPHVFLNRILVDGLDGASAIILHLIAAEHGRWRVETYGAQKSWEMNRASWPTAHRIVGKYSRW